MKGAFPLSDSDRIINPEITMSLLSHYFLLQTGNVQVLEFLQRRKHAIVHYEQFVPLKAPAEEQT